MRATIYGGLVSVVMAASALAGPLTPSVGPVASTAKPLAEIEPRIALSATNTPATSTSVYTITQPGSYYLTGNLAGAAGRNGILIQCSGAVTIDLNGYEIVGSGGTGDFHGIRAIVFIPPSVTIRNGTIRNWAASGIDLATMGVPSCSLIDLRTRNNGTNGIACGSGTTIRNCIADDNAAIGIATGSGCVLTGCVALSNNGDGYLLGSGSNISGCTAYLNGDDGIVTNNGCSVTECTSYANTGDGIEVGAGCVVSGNACSQNGFGAGSGAGIRMVGSENRVEGNNCSLADRGVEAAAPGNMIIRNTCNGNGTNWVFVAGNSYGSLVVSNGATAPAISTSGSATGTVATTDPNANISY